MKLKNTILKKYKKKIVIIKNYIFKIYEKKNKQIKLGGKIQRVNWKKIIKSYSWC